MEDNLIENLHDRMSNLETAIRQLDSPRVSQDDALDQRITLHLDKIYREIHELEAQNKGRLQDVVSVNAQLDDVRGEIHEQDEGIKFIQERQDVMTKDQLHQSERLNSLVKAVEGFAQKQEQQRGMLEVQGELIEAISSWLNVDEYSLGLAERPLAGIDLDKPNYGASEEEKVFDDMVTKGQGIMRHHVPLDEVLERSVPKEVLTHRELKAPSDMEIHTHGQRPRKIVIYLD